MNIQNITAISLILVTNIFNIHAMEHPNSDTTQDFVNVMQTSEFSEIIQTPKFLDIIQRPEFFAMMQTPQFGEFIAAIHSQSSTRIQEALEELLETEAMQLIFETGIFSDDIRAKHNAMQNTEEYENYQWTKQYHKEHNTSDTQDMVNECKKTLRSTQAYTDLLDAANKEMFITNNSVNNNNDHDFSDMKTTEEYQVYEIAKKCHEKYNRPEIKIVMDEALALLLEAQAAQRTYKAKAQENYNKAEQLHATYNTPETETIMQEGLQLVLDAEKLHMNDNSSQIYSNDALIKHRAMEQTPEHQQYEQAKLAYEQNPNEDTEYMLNLCKAELRNTKECQEFLAATEQEQHITDNITNSKKWEAEQPLSFQSLETLLNKRHDAWTAVKNTQEYQSFQKAKLAHEKYNNDNNLFLLNEHQRHAKETQTYKEYYKIEQELLTRTGQPARNNVYTVKTQSKTNNNSYAVNNNNNNDDNNTTTASSTTQPQANSGDYLVERKNPVVPIKLRLSNDGSYKPEETCISSYFNRPTMCEPYNLQLQLSNNNKK
jgi:hypothetical protein